MKKISLFLILILSTQFRYNSCAVGESVGLEAAKILGLATTKAADTFKESTKVLANAAKDIGINAAEKIRESATTLAKGASDVGINSAKEIAGAVKKITYVTWEALGPLLPMWVIA